VQCFGWVMLYGGVGVWGLAGASLLVFHAEGLWPARKRAARKETAASG
jgi:hypothetical protein